MKTITDSRDPRYDKAPANDWKKETFVIPCFDADGVHVSDRETRAEYMNDGDGYVVRVFNAGPYREEAKQTIGDYLVARVRDWDFIN